jgi:hypothetical protein
MTPNNSGRGGLGPVVDIWIEDTPGGQALFVTTTNSQGHEATAALWQPTDTTSEETTDVW